MRGLSKKLLLVVDRPGPPEIKVWKGGPFLEGYVNGVMVGKAMKMSDIFVTDDTERCCIRFAHHTILLTEEEAISIRWEYVSEAERRANDKADKALRDACPYVYKSDQDKWIAKVKAGEIDAKA